MKVEAKAIRTLTLNDPLVVQKGFLVNCAKPYSHLLSVLYNIIIIQLQVQYKGERSNLCHPSGQV